MILSKEMRRVEFYGHEVIATILTVDSLLCPELDKYIKENQKRELIVVELKREISRFELIDLD
jgi:hypothetical protein